jgi:DNA repair exonuclease SbcCD ATPase subunit
MSATENKCVCCLGPFNLDVDEDIPWQICSNLHVLCKRCITSMIKASNQQCSLETSINSSNELEIQFRSGYSTYYSEVKCPVCRENFSYTNRSYNKKTFKFSRNRHYDELLSINDKEPSLALEERRQIKKSIDVSISTMNESFHLMTEQFMNLQQDYSSLIRTQEQEASKFDEKIEQVHSYKNDIKELQDEIKKLQEEVQGLESKKPLIMAQFKREAIAEGKQQIDTKVEEHRKDVISKHEAEIIQLEESHEAIIKKHIVKSSKQVSGLEEKKKRLRGQINDYEEKIASFSDEEHVLKLAMVKYGFNPTYLEDMQKKYELEAQELRAEMINQVKSEATIEKKKFKEELDAAKLRITLELKEWKCNRKKFKQFIELEKKIGSSLAEMTYAPELMQPQTRWRADPISIETAFWKNLKAYEMLENPTYSLSDYQTWKSKSSIFGKGVDAFLTKQRTMYGF